MRCLTLAAFLAASLAFAGYNAHEYQGFLQYRQAWNRQLLAQEAVLALTQADYERQGFEFEFDADGGLQSVGHVSGQVDVLNAKAKEWEQFGHCIYMVLRERKEYIKHGKMFFRMKYFNEPCVI